MVDENVGAASARAAPSFDALVADLQTLRQCGLVELRRLTLSVLGGSPAAVEQVLRSAVEALGSGRLGTAAQYTFGLAQGTRDWPAQDRRRRAAQEYGLSVERFRRQQERIVLEQVAEQMLAHGLDAAVTGQSGGAADESAVAGSGDGASAGTRTVGSETLNAGHPEDVSRPDAQIGTGLDAAARHDHRLAAAVPGGAAGAGDEIEFAVAVGASRATVFVHVLPIELTRGIDVLVGTTNVYFEISRIFGETVSAGLRRAAARTDPAGRIVDDVVQRELAAWVAEHGGPGTAAPPGTVAPTSPGALAERGVRRLYHAAVAVPIDAGTRYVVDDASIVRAVRAVFATARLERDRFDPPLTSLCFPLIGAGRGGLDPDRSIRMLWLGLREELRRDTSWRVHLALRDSDVANSLIRHLGRV